jgi:prolyl oligopeptidase
MTLRTLHSVAFLAVLTPVVGVADSPPVTSGVPPLPPTPVKSVSRVFHGLTVTDPYAWLENGNDPGVRDWTERQNEHTRASLDQYRGLPALRERIKKMLSGVTTDYATLQCRGGKLFAMKFQPPKEQAFLVVRNSPDDSASERVILDPNGLGTKGTTAVDFFEVSRSGKLVAVSLSQGGSEAGTLHVYDVATRKELADVVPRVQFPTAGGSVAWNADDTGFYYTHYPRGDERPKEDQAFYQQLYFHRLGTPTEQDQYVLGKDFPRIAEITLETSPDGRHILATVENGDGGEFSHYLMSAEGKWSQLTHFADHVTAARFGCHGDLYLVSLDGAPRGKLLRLSVAKPSLAEARTVVPEGAAAIQAFRITSNTLAVNFVVTDRRIYLVDSDGGPSQVRVFDTDGKPQAMVPILPVSSVGAAMSGEGDELLFRNSSYLTPPAWYRFDPSSGRVTRTALYSTSPADYSDCEVVREFATSKDGTKVPLNIVCRKGIKRDGRNPTFLTGYGGFGVSLTPGFVSIRRVWLDQGGVLVVANLRGGGEYGEEWHKAGRLTHKQNVFDDFAACAQHLIAKKYTSPDRLVIEGGSNGGLLVGASFTQHPELFRAAVVRVGVLDMLAEDRHANAEFNAAEFGSVKDPDQFKAILAYSPYQNVREDTAYPAVLLVAGANDGRADPANSRKMAARLQAATTSGRPVLLKVSSDAGHGSGTALSRAIDQQADIFGFLFQQLDIAFSTVAK